MAACAWSLAGLSPRVRGNQAFIGLVSPFAVYPRGCGGTGNIDNSARLIKGLSPRVRGNQIAIPCSNPNLGSIPAGAGEPPLGASINFAAAVYPRGCGGTLIAHFLLTSMNGLSPRVRGNPELHLSSQHCYGLSPRVRGNRQKAAIYVYLTGSIPAGAGEPSMDYQTEVKDRVYPRGCGGT